MRTLIFLPTYTTKGKKLAIRPESKLSFDALDACGGDKVISHSNPFPNGDAKNVLHQYQIAQKQALEGGYDYLLEFEHDMIVPPDGLAKLLALDVPVAYGVYMFRHGPPSLNIYKVEGNRDTGTPLSALPDEWKRAEEQVVYECSGTGSGFTLIRRDVLENIPFRALDNNFPPDLALSIDCLTKGYKQFAHFGVKCLHWDGDNQRWLEPSWKSYRVKMEVLETCNVGVNGNSSLHLEKGQVVEVEVPTADTLERATFARRI